MRLCLLDSCGLMCGIAGIYRFRNHDRNISREELRRINNYQIPRGPDAEGEWFSAGGSLGLAHRRLSIIDLRATANQPMVSAAAGLVIVFNGEIYNYLELRRELAEAGCNFVTHSDTEVLLHAYAHWGKACLNRLRGMYAFAIWEEQGEKLFLARDPYGIKPLYYSNDGQSFRFASQAKALLAGGAVSRESSPVGITGFLLMGSVPEPHTIYRDIHAVPAGCSLTVSAGAVEVPRRFFSVPDIWRCAGDNPRLCKADELQTVVTEAVADSVRHHLVADVPVGTFLSAGIDSGALLALMAEQNPGKVQSITLGFQHFEGGSNDETVFAAQLAKQYGSDHTCHWVADSEVERDLPAILAAMDQPSVDGINTWLVSKAARTAGMKVVVSGVGGDELFGGYSLFDVIPKWRRWQAPLRLVPGLATVADATLSRLSHAGITSPKAAAALRYGDSYAGLYLAKRGLFMPWELPELVGEDVATAGLAELGPPEFIAGMTGAESSNDYAALAALEATFYLRNQLLRDADWASMAHSLELRTPLVDIGLLSALAPVLVQRPTGMSRKIPLAKAPARPLPAAIVNRPKTGFSVPMQRWLENSEVLDSWRRVPALRSRRVHWARRMAYSLVSELL